MSDAIFLKGGQQPALPSPVGNGSAGGFQLGYRPALDGLRGLSILAVMGIHSGLTVFSLVVLPDSVSTLFESIGIRNDRGLLPGGWVGVDIFFVLSGFLITLLLVKEWERTGAINFKHFYLRRVLRLLPAMLVVLLALYLFTWWLLPAELTQTRKAIISVLLYYSNLRIIIHNPLPHDLLLHTWSLSIEEQFYFLWPLALWLLLWLRWRRGTVLAILLGVSGIAALARALLWMGSWRGTCLSLMSLPTRLDTLLIGCLAGLLACWGLLPRSHWGLRLLHGAAGLSLLYLGWVCTHLGNYRDRYYFFDSTAIAVSTAVLLASLVSSPPRLVSWVFEFPPLVWLGRISYGLYLWHYPLGGCLIPLIANSPRLQPYLVLPEIVFVDVLAVGVAAVSFYLMEQPILRLKHHLEHQGSGAGVARKKAAA